MEANLKRSPWSTSRGTTLVELLVASTCLGIGISGVMTMIGSGRQEESANFVRNQARIAAISKLETDALHYSSYSTIIPGPPVSANITLYTEANATVTAVLTSRTERRSIDWANSGGTRLGIEYKLVDVSVSWTLAGKPDSVRYLKRVAELR